jgi:uracil-DNA glycosylase
MTLQSLESRISNCRLCADRFAATKTAHEPRPVAWLSPSARILIAGQAPGARVHDSGRPFSDPSGERLRGWMGIDAATFYDRSKFAILPMAFCFPGYDAKGSDLPPPKLCADHWRAQAIAAMPQIRLTLLIGGYAQRWHIGSRNVTEAVAAWRDHAPAIIPLPHPSWRNTSWLRKHPWFEADLVPVLRARIAEELAR